MAKKEVIWVSRPPKGKAPKLPFPSGVKAGDYVFVSGQGGSRDPETGAAAEGIKAQTRQCMENIKRVLGEVELSLSDVVKVTVFLGNMADYTEMNEVYKSFFPDPEDLPARSTAITGLVLPGMLLEVECIAYCPRGGTKNTDM